MGDDVNFIILLFVGVFLFFKLIFWFIDLMDGE